MLKSNILAWLALGLVLLAAVPAAGETVDPATDAALLGDIYVWQGHQYAREGRADLATEAFLKAAECSKSSPYPHFMLARLYARRSLMDASLEFGTGLKLLTADFFYESLLVANILVVALLALAAAFYLGVLVILVRHARDVWFSIVLTYSPVFGERRLRIMMIAGMGAFLLMLSGTSPVAILTWAAVVGCALAWRYATSSERRMMVAFAVFLVAFVPIFDLTARVASAQHPASPTRIAAADRGTVRAGIAKLGAAENLLPEADPVSQFVRGNLSLKAGDYLAAVDHFNQASALAGSRAAVMNNLGVAYHNLGRFEEAGVQFDEALKIAPREALIHYNYSQTLNALLRYDRAQEELERASTLNFDLTRSLVTSRDKPTLIAMGLDTDVLWDMALNPRHKTIRSTYNPIESGWAGLVVLVGLAAGAFALMRKARLPARCDVCGSIVKAQVAKRKRREVLCPGCRAIKQTNADDNNAIEKQMEERVTRLETRRSIAGLVAGLVLPGGTYHLLGSKIKGIVFSFIILLLVAIVVFRGGPIRQVPQLDVGTSIGWAVVLLIVVYGLYAWRSVVLVIKAGREE